MALEETCPAMGVLGLEREGAVERIAPKVKGVSMAFVLALALASLAPCRRQAEGFFPGLVLNWAQESHPEGSELDWNLGGT